MDAPTPTLTTAQAAARLGVAPNSVIVWADAGLLESWRTPGGHRRISAASVEAMIEQRRAQEASRRTRAFRVLVVEDDLAMAELLVGQIGQVLPAAQISVVSDGFVALLQAGRDLPDMMVMDVHLPGMNGLAMIESLRAQPATRALRFVLVSSLLPQDLAGYGQLPDDVPFLSKPVSLSALQDAIGSVLDPVEPAP